MAATIKIYFVGVCTHVRQPESTGVPHRVILIDAWEGRYIRGRIAPHEAKLRFNETDPPLDLHGVHLALDVEGPGPEYKPAYRTCLQRVKDYAPDLPALSEDVVKTGAGVAAFFDVAVGTFSAGVDHEASVAVLEVVTENAPKLKITPFGGPTEERQLQDGDLLQIENIGAKAHDDKPHDFLLHYLIAQSIPGDATWPTHGKVLCGPLPPPYPHNTVGPGCSNSDYP